MSFIDNVRMGHNLTGKVWLFRFNVIRFISATKSFLKENRKSLLNFSCKGAILQMIAKRETDP